MDDQQILKLYDWNDGICFRHPEKGGVPTARIKTLHPRVGGEEEVRACESCVGELERERWVAAIEEGARYEPGHVGEGLP
ncbi:hypothetical protein [Streptomyces sp. NPDC003857]